MKIKKKIASIFSALLIALASISFTSCEDILNILFPELYGKIISVNAVGISKGAIVSWTNGSISSYRLYLNVEETSSGSAVSGYPIEITENKNYYTVTGLTNETEYTFTVYLLDSEGKMADSKSTTAIPKNDTSTSHSYSTSNKEANSVIKVPANQSSITLTGVSGKSITYANVNKNKSNSISYNSVRKYVDISNNSSSLISREAADDCDVNIPDTSFIKHFVPSNDKDITVIPSSSRSGASADTFKKSDPKIGQTRSIYVDQNTDISTFKQESMTLYAIGYEPGNKTTPKCYVWANPANVVSSGSQNNKVSLSVIRSIAEKYISYYQLEEQIFGETSNKMLGKNNNKIDMASNSPTGTVINIVLTDIGKDGTQEKCGVVGYFWAKDYAVSGYADQYASYKATNEGKYFYIDIPFCNYSSTNPSTNRYAGVKNGKNEEVVSDTVISTLFHEYQHMIDYNTKNMANNISKVETWYNEMLSMLCEDVLQTQMGITDTIQKSRLPNFNAYYYYSGIAQYLETNSWISYGTAYAFGSWLIRNYGGVALINAMSTNASQGIDSVVNAVNTTNNSTKTWDNLMEEYLKATALRCSYTKNTSLPTFNKVSDKTSSINRSKGYVHSAAEVNSFSSINESEIEENKITAYTADGINLWKADYNNKSGTKKIYGPVLTKVGVEFDVQPTGFIFHSIGKATSNEVTLYFTPSSNADEELYIFIQDSFDMTAEDITSEIQNSL